jgi:hypothetical protein
LNCPRRFDAGRFKSSNANNLIQLGFDFLSNPAFHGPQQQSQLQVDVQVAVINRELALHSAALEFHNIAFPRVIHIKTAGEVGGQGLSRFTGVLFVHGVSAVNINNGHKSGFSREMTGFTV